MQTIRVMIAALDPMPMERMLCPEVFCVQACLRDGASVVRAVIEGHPDLLILQSELPGPDGFAVMRALKENLTFEFPHILLLLPRGLSLWEGRASDAGADGVLYAPFDGDALNLAARSALAHPLPRAALPTEHTRIDAINALLDTLKAPDDLKGRQALLCCVDLCVASARLRYDLKHLLYPAAGARLSLSPAAVEKNIRTLIERVWLTGDIEAIQRLFGFSVDAERGKPTNRECMLMLCQHVLNALLR